MSRTQTAALATFISLVSFFVFAFPFNAKAQTPSCTLIADPVIAMSGQSVTLSLISSNATAASVDQDVGLIGINGSKSTTVTSTKTFTATVTNANSTATCSATVTVQASSQDSSGGSGGGGGGGSGLQTLQSLVQTAAGLMQLQSALGGNNTANSMCNPWYPQCACNMVPGPKGKCVGGKNTANCQPGVCVNTTNGYTTPGICPAQNKCQGVTSGGGQGNLSGAQSGLAGGLQGLSSVLQGLQGLMGGGGGGSSGGVSGSGAYPTGCTQYYYTATTTSDPCAIFQPNLVSDSFTDVIQPGISNSLLDALGGNTNTNTNSNTNANISTVLNQLTNPSPQNTLSGTNTGQLQNNLSGDVRLGSAGATVFANLKQGLTEISGFFGGNTFDGQTSQSALSRVCTSRPWSASNFVASISPDSFFDNLCRRAGYQVGQVTQTNPVPRNTGFTTNTTPTPIPTAISTGPYIPPEADIRAEPSSVRLGTRTYIFWNSRGVSSCAVTGPSFSQNTLSGAGATVPITGPTVFKIDCLAMNASTTVSDSVTVNLAI